METLTARHMRLPMVAAVAIVGRIGVERNDYQFLPHDKLPVEQLGKVVAVAVDSLSKTK
jgi:hypothetical protein